MAKPVVRVGVHVHPKTWKILREMASFEDIRTYDFFVDSSEPTIWLYLIGESEQSVNRLHEVTTKAGGLPMKSAGEVARLGRSVPVAL